ncbi:MAG: LytTR family transcriptional regulator DNA-binding domain-containing protein, partial [Plesiomonas shigelloides]
IDPARLQKTLQRLYQASAPQPLFLPEPTPPLRQIPCQGHQRIFFLHLEEVEFAHTDLSGVQVVAHQQSGYTPLSLKVLEEKTPLLRCHRQYLVNPEQICELQFTDAAQVDIVTRSGHKVPVSRRYLRAVKDYLNIP